MAGNRSQVTVTEGVTEAWKGFFLHQVLHFRENNLAQSTQDAFSLSLPGFVQEVRLETLLSGPPYTWCGPALGLSKWGFLQSFWLVLFSCSCLELGHSGWKPCSHLAVLKTKLQAEDCRAERQKEPTFLAKSLSKSVPIPTTVCFLYMGWINHRSV